MEISLEVQTLVFLQSILLGVSLSFFYDFLRAIRHSCKASIARTAILDGLFWVVVLISYFLFVIVIVHGEGRAYILLGAVLGTVFYFMTFSPIILDIFGLILGLFKKGWKICRILFKKIQIMLTYLKSKIKIFQKHDKKRKKHFQFPVKRVKIK